MVFVEQYVMVDEHGKKTDLKSEALTHGYLDVLWRESASRARFRDWKSGFSESWNPFESHVYALATRAFFPGVTNVVAELCFLRTGHIIRTEYDWQDNNTFCLITYDNGSTEILWSEIDPILEYILVKNDTVLTTELHANPGRHCTHWYGKPCQFFGKECPLNDNKLISNDLPAILDNNKYSKALQDFDNGLPLTTETAGDCYYAIQQMQHFLSQAEKKIEHWSENHGPIKVGKSSFGWKNTYKYEVDKTYALETILDQEFPMDILPKIVSISKSSIAKLSKKKYGDLRELLETFAIAPVKGDPKFADLKEKEE